MSSFWSRIVVALVGLPVVLGIVWLGGWWLFAVALVGGLMALHELYVMGRGLRPIVLGGYVGLLLTLLGVQLGDVTWMLGGMFATVLVAFVLYGFSDARPSATAAISLTLLGVVWVGGGLGCPGSEQRAFCPVGFPGGQRLEAGCEMCHVPGNGPRGFVRHDLPNASRKMGRRCG